jgi:myo-inositol-1(or 4)-monophosphatase
MAETLEALVAFAHRLADASGEVIRPYFRTQIDITDKTKGKADFDPVTLADREGETVIRNLIKAEYPTHGILGEEHGHEPGSSNYTWVLDPVDGTRAFICGKPEWGTLIALNDGKKPVVGVLDQPYFRERWIGYGGKAEYHRDGKRQLIKTRACPSIEDAVVCTTHPSGYFTPPQREAFDTLANKARMNRYGGDCYGYGLLAMGFVDLIIELLNPWDVQALMPIVEGAGGLVTTWDGKDAQNGGRIVACGDKRLHAQAIEVLSRVP